MECVKCHKNIPEESIFCLFCGKKQTTKAKPKKRRTKGCGSISKHGNKYLVRYRNNYVAVTDTKEEAENALIEYRAKKDDNKPLCYDDTVKDTFDKWLKDKSKTLSLNVYKDYQSKFDNYFCFIQDKKVRDVKTDTFQAVIDNASKMYGYDVCAKLRTIARGICEQAMKNDLINKNYGDLLSMPTKKKVNKSIFTDEEIEKLWKHKDNIYVQVMLVMIYTGLRSGEFFSTKLENIDLDKQTIITGIKTKAGIDRVVPISDFIKPLLENIMSKSIRVLFGGICTYDYYIKKEFKKALLLCGIDNNNLDLYACRRTFYTLCKKNNVDTAILRKIFGHVDDDVGIEHYYYPQIEEKLDVVNALKK